MKEISKSNLDSLLFQPMLDQVEKSCINALFINTKIKLTESLHIQVSHF